MTRLQVETADFHEAASTVRHNVAESVGICLQGLTFSPELVGEDPAGEAWSAAYDPAARTVLRATAQLVNAAGRTSLLFAHSGHNYARAEAASTANGGDVPDFGELLHPLPVATAPSMPRSGGAGNGNPSGWWLIEHTIGLVWPGGHQDRLRQTAAEWRSAARGIESVSFDPVVAAAAFTRDRLPEADDMGTVCAGLSKRLKELAHSYRTLGDACEQYAEHLDTCHNAVEDELGDLVRDSAVTQGAGAALAFFTLGGSEVAAQATQAARIAVAITRVTSLIQRFISAGRTIAAFLERVHEIAVEINRSMSALSDVAIVSSAATNARNVPRIGSTAGPGKQMYGPAGNEAAAAGRLAQGVRIKRKLNDKERTHILDGDENGGGHAHRESNRDPTKTKFPRHWSDEQIIGNIEDVLMSDNTKWYAQTGNGGVLTAVGSPARWRAWEIRDGIRIRVIWEPATGVVRSAFPDPDTTAKGVAIP